MTKVPAKPCPGSKIRSRGKGKGLGKGKGKGPFNLPRKTHKGVARPGE